MLQLSEVAAPTLGPGEILIDVAAAGVNNADMTARAGRYPLRTPVPGIHFYPFRELPAVPGIELAGTVAEVAEGETRWTVGDPVCGIAGSGTYARQAKMLSWAALPVPAGVSMVEAASIPIAFLTVWLAFRELAAVQRGDTVLVQAVGAGVGQAAVQFAHLLGARVLGTELRDEKLARAKALGLDAGCNSAQRDFVEWALQETGGQGVDAILDTVGGAIFARSLACLARDGRIVCLSTAAGSEPVTELSRIIGNHLRVIGMSTAAMISPDRIRRFSRELLSAMPAVLRPVVDRVFDLTDAAEAHRYLAGATHFGKVVLKVAV